MNDSAVPRTDYSDKGDADSYATHDVYAYFHGDNEAGLEASHQTGWTELAARMIAFYGAVGATSVRSGDPRPAAQTYWRSDGGS